MKENSFLEILWQQLNKEDSEHQQASLRSEKPSSNQMLSERNYNSLLTRLQPPKNFQSRASLNLLKAKAFYSPKTRDNAQATETCLAPTKDKLEKFIFLSPCGQLILQRWSAMGIQFADNKLSSVRPRELKRAYRSLAKKYHPDSRQDGSENSSLFFEINEQYQILKAELSEDQHLQSSQT